MLLAPWRVRRFKPRIDRCRIGAQALHYLGDTAHSHHLGAQFGGPRRRVAIPGQMLAHSDKRLGTPVMLEMSSVLKHNFETFLQRNRRWIDPDAGTSQR